MNQIEFIVMTVPGVLGLLWFIITYLVRKLIKGPLLISSFVFQGIYALLWIATAISVKMFPGGHPPGAALVAILAVLVTLIASPISLILAVASAKKNNKLNGIHIESIVSNLIAFAPCLYAALYIR